IPTGACSTTISMPKGCTGRSWTWRATVGNRRLPRWYTCSARPLPAPPRTSPCDEASSSISPSTRRESPWEASQSAGVPSRGSSWDPSSATSYCRGSSRAGSFDPAIDFEVYDGANPASSPLLYDRDGIRRTTRQGNESLFSTKSRISLAGREWTLYFATLSRFEEGAESNLPAFVLVSGLGLSLLIFGITLLVVRSRTRAEDTSKELAVANRELGSFYHSVEQELGMARSIQHALLPKDLPRLADWKITYHYQPAREVGGDFYDFLRLEEGRLGLVIGDVSGKGIAAALVMANTQSVLRAIARR